MADTEIQKKRSKSRKKPEPEQFTQERRDFLLAVEAPPHQEVRQSGRPHLCATCSHCRIIRSTYSEKRESGRHDSKGASIIELQTIVETEYLCAQLFNSPRWGVLTCELYEKMPSEHDQRGR